MTKEDKLIEIGNIVREARIRVRLSQTELAHSIGKDQPSINRLEKGKIYPSYVYLTEVCEGLNISMEELFSNQK